MNRADERLGALLHFPWTIQSEQVGDVEIALRVAELPFFVVAGPSATLDATFWTSLTEYLRIAIKYEHSLPDIREIQSPTVEAFGGDRDIVTREQRERAARTFSGRVVISPGAELASV